MDWYAWADEPADKLIEDEFKKIGNEFISEVKPDDDWEKDWEELMNDPDFLNFV